MTNPTRRENPAPGGATRRDSVADPTRREETASGKTTRRESDEGPTRREDPPASSTSSDFGLPADLAARFEVVRALDAAGSEADAFLVRDQGTVMFAKIYRRGIRPNSEVLRR